MVYMREGDKLDVEARMHNIAVVMGSETDVDVEIKTGTPENVCVYVNGEPWGPIVERS